MYAYAALVQSTSTAHLLIVNALGELWLANCSKQTNERTNKRRRRNNSICFMLADGSLWGAPTMREGVAARTYELNDFYASLSLTHSLDKVVHVCSGIYTILVLSPLRNIIF